MQHCWAVPEGLGWLFFFQQKSFWGSSDTFRLRQHDQPDAGARDGVAITV
jgi:hypothetical protein